MFYDITVEELEQKSEDILDWTYVMDKIDDFWRGELNSLINWGGKKLTLKMLEGYCVEGILTGVHMSYLELNDSLKLYFDDIDTIIFNIKNDKK